MTKSLNAPILDRCNLRSETTWDTLYHLLVARVRYWVCSSHVSLWRGQEEDIIADIVQEAITRTFGYTALVKEGEGIPCNSLKHIGVVIAYKCFQDIKHRDCRFVRTLLHRPSSREHAVISERVDLSEIVLDKTFRESLLVNLARDIAAIPKKQRTALLIELANRTYANARPSLMQKAFLEVEIRLQDYRQPLPNDPIERSMHVYQVQLACKQIMKKQKSQEEQNTIEVVNKDQEPTSSHRDPDADTIQNDLKLVALAAHLDATAPFAAVDPAFRQALRDRLLEHLADRRPSEARGEPPEQVPGGVGLPQQATQADAISDDLLPLPSHKGTGSGSIQAIERSPASVAEPSNGRDGAEVPNSGQEPISLPRDLSLDDIEDNAELAGLVAYLNATAPSAIVDPVFRARLREKLLGTAAEHYVAEAVKEAPDNVAEIGFETVFEKSHLANLVHEIADFPDEERTALLIDLANRTHFDLQPTQLLQAFLEGGIRLQDYESLLPDDPIKRRSHNFFLNLAYKRVVKLQEALRTLVSTG